MSDFSTKPHKMEISFSTNSLINIVTTTEARDITSELLSVQRTTCFLGMMKQLHTADECLHIRRREIRNLQLLTWEEYLLPIPTQKRKYDIQIWWQVLKLPLPAFYWLWKRASSLQEHEIDRINLSNCKIVVCISIVITIQKLQISRTQRDKISPMGGKASRTIARTKIQRR